MNAASGRYLALGVAAIFASACDSSKQAASAEPGEKAAAADESGMADMAKGKPGEVHCLGIHECKGQSECHIAGGHACAGMNDCKGKGWINVSSSECAAKGGKIAGG